MARGAQRRPRGRGRRAARASLARRGRRGAGRRVPHEGGRPRAPGVRTRRGDRALPGALADPGASRRAPGDGARTLQARPRAPHVAALRRGERDVPASVRFLDATAPVARTGDCGAPRLIELPAERPRSPLRNRLAEHPALHATVRPAGRAVAGTHDRPEPGGAMGDRGRRSALRFPSARGARVVGRDSAHRPRHRIRDQAGTRPGRTGLERRDLLRPGERAGALPAAEPRPGRDRRPGARRPHRRIPPRRARTVLHERHEPPRRRTAAAARDRSRGSRSQPRGRRGPRRVGRS